MVLNRAAYRQLEQYLRTTGRNSGSSNLIGITTEGADVLLDPLESMLHVPKRQVGGATLVQEGRAVGQAGDAESVVVRNEDEVLGQVEETLGGVLIFAATSESTTIRPDHDREFLALAVDRGLDVHVETVLGGGAVDVGIGQGAIVDLRLDRGPLRLSPAELARGHSGKADVLVFVVAQRVITCNRNGSAVVERDGGCGRIRGCYGWGVLALRGDHGGCQGQQKSDKQMHGDRPNECETK